MTQQICLIGTIHNDYRYRGPERLEKLLKHLKPSIIALESTEEDAIAIFNNYLKDKATERIMKVRNIESPG